MPPDAARSRTGCATCKARKKKCDEQFSPRGAEGAPTCERCRLGSYACVPGATVVRIRTRRERAEVGAGASPVASTSRLEPGGEAVSAPSPAVVARPTRDSSELKPTPRLSPHPHPNPPPPAAPPSPLSQAALGHFLAELSAPGPVDAAGVLDAFGQSWASVGLPLVPLDNSGWATSDAGLDLDPAPVDLGSKHQFCQSPCTCAVSLWPR